MFIISMHVLQIVKFAMDILLNRSGELFPINLLKNNKMADPQYSQKVLNIDARMQFIYDECVSEVIGRHSVDATNTFSPAIRDDLYLLHRKVIAKQATEEENIRYRPLYLEISTVYAHKLRQLSAMDPTLAQYLQYQQMQATQQMVQQAQQMPQMQQVQQAYQPTLQQQQQPKSPFDIQSQSSHMMEFAYQTQGQQTQEILRTLREYYDSYAQQLHMPQIVDGVFAQLRLIFCYLFCMIKLAGDITKATEIEQAFNSFCREKNRPAIPLFTSVEMFKEVEEEIQMFLSSKQTQIQQHPCNQNTVASELTQPLSIFQFIKDEAMSYTNFGYLLIHPAAQKQLYEVTKVLCTEPSGSQQQYQSIRAVLTKYVYISPRRTKNYWLDLNLDMYAKISPYSPNFPSAELYQVFEYFKIQCYTLFQYAYELSKYIVAAIQAKGAGQDISQMTTIINNFRVSMFYDFKYNIYRPPYHTELQQPDQHLTEYYSEFVQPTLESLPSIDSQLNFVTQGSANDSTVSMHQAQTRQEPRSDLPGANKADFQMKQQLEVRSENRNLLLNKYRELCIQVFQIFNTTKPARDMYPKVIKEYNLAYNNLLSFGNTNSVEKQNAEIAARTLYNKALSIQEDMRQKEQMYYTSLQQLLSYEQSIGKTDDIKAEMERIKRTIMDAYITKTPNQKPSQPVSQPKQRVPLKQQVRSETPITSSSPSISSEAVSTMEESTESSGAQPVFDDTEDTQDQIVSDEPSDVPDQETDVEEENYIGCVLDCKRIPMTSAWLYTPSLLIKPDPDPSTIGKYDFLRPKGIHRLGRSDGGIATVRIDFLFEDLDNVNNVIEISPEEENMKRSAEVSSRITKVNKNSEKSNTKDAPQDEKKAVDATKTLIEPSDKIDSSIPNTKAQSQSQDISVLTNEKVDAADNDSTNDYIGIDEQRDVKSIKDGSRHTDTPQDDHHDSKQRDENSSLEEQSEANDHIELEEQEDLTESSDTVGTPRTEARRIAAENEHVYIFLIKWQRKAHYHATWELEDYLMHLSSYVKVKNYKKKYEKIQGFICNKDTDELSKEDIKDKIRSQKLQIRSYMIPEKIVGMRIDTELANHYNEKLTKIFSYMHTDTDLNLRYSEAFAGTFIRNVGDNKLHYYPEFNNSDSESVAITEFNFNDPDVFCNRQLDEDGYLPPYPMAHSLDSHKDQGTLSDSIHTSAIDKISGYVYLVKWRDLPYSQVTDEYYEDLVANPYIRHEYLYKLISDFKARSDAISQTLNKASSVGYDERPTLSRDLQSEVDAVVCSSHPPFLVDVSDNLILRDHQIDGVKFLILSWLQKRNIILADDLGVGKTIQTIAFISALHNHFHVPGPFLIVVPISTLSAWQMALSDWCPNMTVVTLIGTKEDREVIVTHEFYFKPEGDQAEIATGDASTDQYMPEKIPRFHILLTTPQMAVKHEEDLMSFQWRLLAIDEAHSLKNSASIRTTTFSRYKTDAKLLITGTPIQNSIEELFNLLNFIEPEIFSNIDVFACRGEKNVEIFKNALQTWENTITPSAPSLNSCSEILSSQQRVDAIRSTIQPYILRRVKSIVEKCIPPRKELILRVHMTHLQVSCSEWLLEQNYEMLTAKSYNSVKLQNLLMQLRKVCNHPYIIHDLKLHTASLKDIVDGSGKFQVLDKLLDRLNSEGHRVLIFSQLIKTLDILERYCFYKKYKFQRLQGSMTSEQRRRAINTFNEKNSKDFIFLLSTRSGGQGINLATADTVIIFDADYNPQNDLQAAGRVHRIGQSKPVTIYRLVTRDSVEERILDIGHRKLMLDYAIIQRKNGSANSIDDDQPAPDRKFPSSDSNMQQLSNDEVIHTDASSNQSQDQAELSLLNKGTLAVNQPVETFSVINEQGEVVGTDTLSSVTVTNLKSIAPTTNKQEEQIMRHVVRFGAEQLTKMEHGHRDGKGTQEYLDSNSLDIDQILSRAEEVNYEDLSQNKFGKLPGNTFRLSDLSSDSTAQDDNAENDQDFWCRVKDTIMANNFGDGGRKRSTGQIEQTVAPGKSTVNLVQFSFLQTREIMKIVKLLRRFGTTTNAHIQQIYSVDKTIATTLVSDVNLKHFCDSILELCKKSCIRRNHDPLHTVKSATSPIPFMATTINPTDLCKAYYTMLLLESIVFDEKFVFPAHLVPPKPSWATAYPSIIDIKLLLLTISDGFFITENDIPLMNLEEIMNTPGLEVPEDPPRGSILKRIQQLLRLVVRLPSHSAYTIMEADNVRINLAPDLSVFDDQKYLEYYQRTQGLSGDKDEMKAEISRLVETISQVRGMDMVQAEDLDDFNDYTTVSTTLRRNKNYIPQDILSELGVETAMSMSKTALHNYLERQAQNKSLLNTCFKIPNQQRSFKTCLNIIKKHVTSERKKRMSVLLRDVLIALGNDRKYLLGVRVPICSSILLNDKYVHRLDSTLTERSSICNSPDADTTLPKYITAPTINVEKFKPIATLTQAEIDEAHVTETKVSTYAQSVNPATLSFCIHNVLMEIISTQKYKISYLNTLKADFLAVSTSILNTIASRSWNIMMSCYEYLHDNKTYYTNIYSSEEDALYALMREFEADLANFLFKYVTFMIFPTQQEPACVLWYICQSFMMDAQHTSHDESGFKISTTNWKINESSDKTLDNTMSSISYTADISISFSEEKELEYHQHLIDSKNDTSRIMSKQELDNASYLAADSSNASSQDGDGSGGSNF